MDSVTAPVAGDPHAVLVATLRRWVAEHADMIECLGLAVSGQRTIHVECRYLREANFERGSMRGNVRALDVALRDIRGFPKFVDFCITVMGPGGKALSDSFPLDDQNAAVEIADRLRSADDLRAELDRVRSDLDAVLAVHVEPEIELYFDDAGPVKRRPTGLWLASDLDQAMENRDERFPDRESACRAVIEQARAIVAREREEGEDDA